MYLYSSLPLTLGLLSSPIIQQHQTCSPISTPLKMTSGDSFPTLDQWSINPKGGVTGIVASSPMPEVEVGEVLKTSKLRTNPSSIINGAVVQTRSGTKYRLGIEKKSKPTGKERVVKPTPPVEVNIPKIEEWSLTKNGQIKGQIYGTKELPDGNDIITSMLFRRTGLRKGATVTTVTGSNYQLGTKKGAQKSAPVAPEKKKSSNGFSLFRNKEKEDSASDIQKVIADEPPKKKRPAPFASVGRGITKGTGRDAPRPEENVPVLENWFINRREQLVGKVDGSKITTAEIATNMEFAVEGFTVVTMDGRKYQLGEPKGGSKKDYNDEMADYVTPTLVDWEVIGNMQLKGTIQGTDDIITTDTIISDKEYVDEGFTVVTESGKMFKLGGRNNGKKKKKPISFGTFGRGNLKRSKRDSPSTSSESRNPEVSLPSVVAPKISNPFEKDKDMSPVSPPKSVEDAIPTLDNWSINSQNQVTGTISNSLGRDGEVMITSEMDSNAALKAGSLVYTNSYSAFRLGKRSSASFLSSADARLPTLNQWAITPFGGITGTVSNCPDPDVEDGEILTTSTLQTDIEILQEGQTVVTRNGSEYILGVRKKVSRPVESPPTDFSGGLWIIAVITFVTLIGELN